MIVQYSAEHELSNAKRDQLLAIAADGVPWFMALTLGAAQATSAAMYLIFATPPVSVCDPAFVAEMPDSPGALLKIGHFDGVGGITHVEI